MCEYTYTLTAQEIRRALWTARRSPLKAWTQTALLGLLSLSAWIGYFRGDRSAGTLLMAVALPLLTAAVWLIPAVSFRREAKAAAPLTVTLRLTAEEIGVGETGCPLSGAALVRGRDMVIWRPDKYQMVAVPRRALPPEAWSVLEEAVKG